MLLTIGGRRLKNPSVHLFPSSQHLTVFFTLLHLEKEIYFQNWQLWRKVSALFNSSWWKHADSVIAAFSPSGRRQRMQSFRRWWEHSQRRCATESNFLAHNLNVSEGTLIPVDGVPPCHVSHLAVCLRGSVILQWLNSGGLEQQDRGEPGGDLLTLRWLIASQGLSYANAFISKSTVII